jgi:hypothetical protein
MANSSVNLLSLDFAEIKQDFVTFLRSKDGFKDYDYEGSNMNMLIELLSYNTYKNSFYTNMVASEMFLDSAQLKDSVVSHSKILNYIPRSFKSAYANVNFVATVPIGLTQYVLPKGTAFSSRVGGNSFVFSTSETVVLNEYTSNTTSNTSTFTGNFYLYEGGYLTDTFIKQSGPGQRFILSNFRVDTSSMTVTVIEDNGAYVAPYFPKDTLFDLNANSEVYFLQAAENNQYEILFGDGVIGRTPKDGSTIAVEYRVSSGELPNGASKFTTMSTLTGNVVITTLSNAIGGAVSESISSVKFNAPRHFQRQERVITTNDYENVLQQQFPEIGAITAFGGEDSIPPQYGKVFVAIKLKDSVYIPESRKLAYTQYLKDKSPLTIEAVIIEPKNLYIDVQTTVNYNVNVTLLSIQDIKALVLDKIQTFNTTYLENFKSELKFSRLVSDIDSSHESVISNITNVRAFTKISPVLGVATNYSFSFEQPLMNDQSPVTKVHDSRYTLAVKSSQFTYKGAECVLEDDGAGNLNIVTEVGSKHVLITKTGTVNYDTGDVTINNLEISAIVGDTFNVYGHTRTPNINTKTNVILSIPTDSISITVNAVRE